MAFRILANGTSQAVNVATATSVVIPLALNQTRRVDLAWSQTEAYNIQIAASANIVDTPLFFPGGCAETQSFRAVVRPTGVSDESGSAQDPTKASFDLNRAGSLILSAKSSAITYTLQFGTGSGSAPEKAPPIRCQSISSVTLPPKCVGKVNGFNFIDLRYDSVTETDTINQIEADLVAQAPTAASNSNCLNFYLGLACKEEFLFCSDLYNFIAQPPSVCLQDCLAGANTAGCTGYNALQVCSSRISCASVTDASVPVSLAPQQAPAGGNGGQQPTSATSPSQTSSPSQLSSSPTQSSSPGSSATPTAAAQPSKSQVNGGSAVTASALLLAALVLAAVAI
eukprot:TRINITY_DN5219_c0_g1_i4.p1 TRINITY_DN5219_c0_g1~~TRINITY_DN5219_c0_g1_i4.p1  ORF type:complete len:340 (+),score=59.43 TRINITY_DN5219_c0_g1_i4:981-2000(+)